MGARVCANLTRSSLQCVERSTAVSTFSHVSRPKPFAVGVVLLLRMLLSSLLLMLMLLLHQLICLPSRRVLQSKEVMMAEQFHHYPYLSLKLSFPAISVFHSSHCESPTKAFCSCVCSPFWFMEEEAPSLLFSE